MVDEKMIKKFLLTEEAQKIKALEVSMGMQLNGLMVTAFEKWIASELKQDPVISIFKKLRS